MTTKEDAVRTAATKLHDAIVAARKVGLRVDWPTTVEGLSTIQISETAQAELATTITITVDGLDPESPQANKAEQAAKKAVDTVVDPAVQK